MGSGACARQREGGPKAWARERGGAGRPAAYRCINPRGNPRLHLGAARKLHHVWATTSEGADPPLPRGTPGQSLSPRKGGSRTVGGVDKFSADWQKAARLGRWSPEVSSAVENRPLPPLPIEVVQPENFSFIKRKDSARSK